MDFAAGEEDVTSNEVHRPGAPAKSPNKSIVSLASAFVDSHHELDGFISYRCSLQTLFVAWTIRRRYSEFDILANRLSIGTLPAKGTNMANEKELLLRRDGLEKFLCEVLKQYPSLPSPKKAAVEEFLEWPSYSYTHIAFHLSVAITGCAAILCTFTSKIRFLSCIILQLLPWWLCYGKLGWLQHTLHPQQLLLAPFTATIGYAVLRQRGVKGTMTSTLLPSLFFQLFSTPGQSAGGGLLPPFLPLRCSDRFSVDSSSIICRQPHELTDCAIDTAVNVTVVLVAALLLVVYRRQAKGSTRREETRDVQEQRTTSDLQSSCMLLLPAADAGMQVARHYYWLLHSLSQVNGSKQRAMVWMCGSALQCALLVAACNAAHHLLFVRSIKIHEKDDRKPRGGFLTPPVPLAAVVPVLVLVCFGAKVVSAALMSSVALGSIIDPLGDTSAQLGSFGASMRALPLLLPVMVEVGLCVALSRWSGPSWLLPASVSPAQLKQLQKPPKNVIVAHVEGVVKAFLLSKVRKAIDTKAAALGGYLYSFALAEVVALAALVVALALSRLALELE
jgi:hypothetical protein